MLSHELLDKVKSLAIEYRDSQQRPLGVTGEIAELEACRLLGLVRASVRQPGFDAVHPVTDNKYQIKGRVISGAGAKGNIPGISKINRNFDLVLLVVLDANYNVTDIYQASKLAVLDALDHLEANAGAKQRGQLSFSTFKRISEKLVLPV